MPGEGFVTHSEYQKHIRGEWRTIHNLWPHIRKYVPGWGYSKAEIDAMFVGTEGSVAFADASGFIAEDNANFFWDAATLRLGIGTATPDVALDIEFDAVATVISRVSAQTRPWRHWECVSGHWGLAIGIDANDGIIHFNYDAPIGTMNTIMMVFDGPSVRVGILDSTPSYPLDVGGDTQIQGSFRVTGGATFLSTLDVTGLLSNTGGAKLEIQGGVNGGSTRGIFLWDTSSTSWGIYVSESGAGKSLANGVACTNFAGDVGHHIRFRIVDTATRAFVWENSSETCLMDLEADTGNLTILGNFALRSSKELRFYDNGHYVGFEAPALDADQIWVLPNADGDANDVLITDGGGNLAWIPGVATDEKVKVDVGAVAGYLGAAFNDGVLRTGAPLTYADGGDFITLGVDQTAIDHDALLNTHANPYKLDDLGAPDDNTDLDFSTATHGLVPKGTDVGNFLKDDGTWAAGGGGESNTASNQGSGVSIYFQKVGVDLQFNAIKSENNRLAVALDGVTHDVELTLVEGNIDHDALLNTHANPYKLDDLAAPDDNTDLDFSTTKHGLVPKGTDVGDYLKDDGTWDTPAGGDGAAAGPVLIFDSGFDDLALGNINGKGAYDFWGTWVNASGAGCTAEIVADPGNGRMLRLDDQSAVNECHASLTMTPSLSAEVLVGVVEWKVKINQFAAGSRGYFNIQDKDIGATEQGAYFRGDSNDIYYRSSGGTTAHLVNAVVDTWYIVRTFFDRLGNYTVWWVDGAFEKNRVIMNAGDKFDKLVFSTRDIHSGNVFDIKYVKVWSLNHVEE